MLRPLQEGVRPLNLTEWRYGSDGCSARFSTVCAQWLRRKLGFRELFLTAFASQNVLLKKGQSLRVRQILDWASPSGSLLERRIYTPSPRRKITCSVQP